MALSAALLRSNKRAIWQGALHAAVLEVFDTLLGVRLEPAAEDYAMPQFTAMVGLAGDLRGVMGVSCSKATAVEMTSRMLQTDCTTEAQIWDALGEVCNVLAGRFKNGPPRIADNCVLSVPTVIAGSNYSQHSAGGLGTMKQCYRMHEEIILITLTVNECLAGH